MVHNIVHNIVRIAIIMLLLATFFTGMVESKIVIPIGIMFLFVSGLYMIVGFICQFLTYSWVCEWAGTHFPSNRRSFDGCSQHSKCRKCGCEILQDGQGNWF